MRQPKSPWKTLAEARPPSADVYLVAGLTDEGPWRNVLMFDDAGDVDDDEANELPPVIWWAQMPAHPMETKP